MANQQYIAILDEHQNLFAVSNSDIVRFVGLLPGVGHWQVLNTIDRGMLTVLVKHITKTEYETYLAFDIPDLRDTDYHWIPKSRFQRFMKFIWRF